MNRIRKVLPTVISLFVSAVISLFSPGMLSADTTTIAGKPLQAGGYIMSMNKYEQGMLVSVVNEKNEVTWFSQGREVFTTMLDQSDKKQKIISSVSYKADGTRDYVVDNTGAKTYFEKNQPQYEKNAEGFVTKKYEYVAGFLFKTIQRDKMLTIDANGKESYSDVDVSETIYKGGRPAETRSLISGADMAKVLDYQIKKLQADRDAVPTEPPQPEVIKKFNDQIAAVEKQKADCADLKAGAITKTFYYDGKGAMSRAVDNMGNTSYFSRGGRIDYVTNSEGAKTSEFFYKNGVMSYSYRYDAGTVTSTTIYDYHGREKFVFNGDLFDMGNSYAKALIENKAKLESQIKDAQAKIAQANKDIAYANDQKSKGILVDGKGVSYDKMITDANAVIAKANETIPKLQAGVNNVIDAQKTQAEQVSIGNAIGNFFKTFTGNIASGIQQIINGALSIAGYAKDSLTNVLFTLVKAQYVYSDEDVVNMQGFGAKKNSDGSVAATYTGTMYDDNAASITQKFAVMHNFGTCMGVITYGMNEDGQSYAMNRTIIENGKEIATIGFDTDASDNMNLGTQDAYRTTGWTDPAIKGTVKQMSLKDYLVKSGVNFSQLTDSEKTALLKQLSMTFYGNETSLSLKSGESIDQALNRIQANVIDNGQIDKFDFRGWNNVDKSFLLGFDVAGDKSTAMVGKSVFLSGAEASTGLTRTIQMNDQTRARSSGNVVSTTKGGTEEVKLDGTLNLFRIDMFQYL